MRTTKLKNASMLVGTMALFGAAFLPGASAAQAFTVVPVAQDFAPGDRDAQETLVIENGQDEPVLLRLQVMSRTTLADGRESNAPTSDFAVFPVQTVVGPKQSQVVRLQWRGAEKLDRELAYRVIAEQHPLANRPKPTHAIKLAVRFVGSVYVVPEGAAADVVVESARAVTAGGERRLELVLENRGLAHTLIDEPTVAVSAGGETRQLSEAAVKGLDGANILAGSKLTVRLPWPDGMPTENPKASLKFTPVR